MRRCQDKEYMRNFVNKAKTPLDLIWTEMKWTGFDPNWNELKWTELHPTSPYFGLSTLQMFNQSEIEELPRNKTGSERGSWLRPDPVLTKNQSEALELQGCKTGIERGWGLCLNPVSPLSPNNQSNHVARQKGRKQAKGVERIRNPGSLGVNSRNRI